MQLSIVETIRTTIKDETIRVIADIQQQHNDSMISRRSLTGTPVIADRQSHCRDALQRLQNRDINGAFELVCYHLFAIHNTFLGIERM